METQPIKLTVIAVGLAAVTLMGLLPSRATAQDRPQEVLNLVSAHQALAMKIRPLQDRVLAAQAQEKNSTHFNPDGVPVRAKTNATTGESNAAAERRIAETLRHKNRAATAGDDYGRIKTRLSTLERNARAERERVNRPRFGAGSATRDSESGNVRFGDGRLGARPTSGSQQQNKTGAGAAGNIDNQEIATARKSLAALQREFAALEREANALGLGTRRR